MDGGSVSHEEEAMSALFVGDTASTAVLGLSPWIIPLIAVAAKLTYDRTRGAIRCESPQDRSSPKADAGQEDGPRHHDALNEPIETKMAGK
jgi:hypothetical protein